MKKEMMIEGMSCSHCSSRVEQALNGVPGVKAKVDLERKTAYLELEQDVPDETLKQAVEQAGYQVVNIHAC